MCWQRRVTPFLRPWKEEKCLEQRGRLHTLLFFINRVKSELGPKACDQPAVRAGGGHWSSVERRVPAYGRVGKGDLKMRLNRIEGGACVRSSC